MRLGPRLQLRDQCRWVQEVLGLSLELFEIALTADEAATLHSWQSASWRIAGDPGVADTLSLNVSATRPGSGGPSQAKTLWNLSVTLFVMWSVLEPKMHCSRRRRRPQSMGAARTWHNFDAQIRCAG